MQNTEHKINNKKVDEILSQTQVWIDKIMSHLDEDFESVVKISNIRFQQMMTEINNKGEGYDIKWNRMRQRIRKKIRQNYQSEIEKQNICINEINRSQLSKKSKKRCQNNEGNIGKQQFMTSWIQFIKGYLGKTSNSRYEQKIDKKRILKENDDEEQGFLSENMKIKDG